MQSITDCDCDYYSLNNNEIFQTSTVLCVCVCVLTTVLLGLETASFCYIFQSLVYNSDGLVKMFYFWIQIVLEVLENEQYYLKIIKAIQIST